jgi:peroxiredoxin
VKRFLIPALALAVVIGAVAWLEVSQQKPRTGYEAPDFSLPDLSGATHRLSEYRGKVVFLNLWATWCPPCRMEMPAMERLHQRMQGRDFVLLAVSEDEGGLQAVAPFVGELGLTFQVLLDPQGSVSPRYGVTGYPETFIIDRNGHVVQHVIGPEEWDSDAMVRYFLALLDTTPAAG